MPLQKVKTLRNQLGETCRECVVVVADNRADLLEQLLLDLVSDILLVLLLRRQYAKQRSLHKTSMCLVADTDLLLQSVHDLERTDLFLFCPNHSLVLVKRRNQTDF